MDPERVDALLRMLVSPKSRRASIRLLAASLAGGLGLAAAGPSVAKPRKKKKCPTGKIRCKVSKKKSVCVDLATDAANCGDCGKVCPGPTSGSGSPTCTGSACGLSCSGATADRCGTDCIDLQTDPQHCNACGTACPHNACQTPTCAAGVCGTTPNACPTTTGEQCYWMNCNGFGGACCWVPTSSIGIDAPDQATCQDYDCCNGGGCHAPGGGLGCYKWSTSACD